MTQAAICTIGDEILIGQIVDTNSSHISRALNSLGIRVRTHQSIGDDNFQIISSLDALLKENQIVIVTGGLGPTKDDITKKALAQLSGAKTVKTDQRQLEIVHRILSARGLDMLEINRAQADVPDTCEVIPNKLGTAPIMVFRFPAERFGHKAVLYSMPGVPFETIAALDDVLEDIKAHFDISDIFHYTLNTFGMAESALSRKIASWEDSLDEDMHLAYLPNPLSGVRLRLSIYGGERSHQEERAMERIRELKEILGKELYYEGE